MADDEVKEGKFVSSKESLKPIQLPPDNVIGSAFLTAIKYRTIASALNAYESAVMGLVGIKYAQAEFNRAALEELRTIESLNDSHTIHRTDKAIRDADLLRAEQHLQHVEHEAYLAKKEREVEKHNADVQHAKLMGVTDTDDLSEEEQEAEGYMLEKLRPSRYKTVAEKIKKENSLSKEQEKILDELVEQLSHQS